MTPRQDAALLSRLSGGDRRSIGQAEAVASQVLGDPGQFGVLWGGLRHADPRVRMRAADAIEKISRQRPTWLRPYKAEFLDLLAGTTEMELRWHLIQMAPRLPYSDAERDSVLGLLRGHLEDASRLVVTCAMQAIAELSASDAKLHDEAMRLIRDLTQRGSPAMRARGRKLLAWLERDSAGMASTATGRHGSNA